MEKEIITLKHKRYLVVDRRIINYAPAAGEVFAELQVVKPHRGQVLYAVDEIFEGLKAKELTGLPFIDDAIQRQPPLKQYGYILRPDRELNQGNLERKFQAKSPCCNRTLREIVIRHGLRPHRFCRKCDREVF